MKNLKRVFSAVLAMVFVLSAVPVVMAEGEATGSGGSGGGTTVEPEIMFYRDFEDYTGGDPYNVAQTNRDYGTWGICGDSTYDDATMVEGVDGKAAKLQTISNNNNTNRNDGTTAFTPKTEGKLYFAFDLDTSANVDAASGVYTQIAFKESGETEGTYGSDLYAFVYEARSKKYVGGDNQYTANASWQVNTATGVSADSKNRIELVADIDNGKIYKYINGVLGATYDDTGYDKMDDIAWITFNPKGGNVIDNFTVIHYPSNASQQTFTVETAKVSGDNAFSVFLKGAVTDSDAKGTDEKAAITATYPVTLADSQLTADAFTIDGLTVTGVTRGTKVGEYRITVSEEVAVGKYTITAKTGLEDITGAIVSETANTATVTKVIEPEIMFYRDFEDYTGGDPYNTADANRDYGTWGIAGDKTYDGATAVQGATGTAVKYPDGININDGNSAFTSKTEGKLYFAFDLDSSAHANATSGVYTQIVFKESGATEGTYGSDVYAFTYNAVKNQYVGGDNQYNSNASWGVNTATGISEDRKNRIELVFDIDDGKIYKYVNGVLGATHDDTEYGNLDDLAYISFNPRGGNVVDNLTVVHYPKAAVQQTFAVETANVSGDNAFSVFLKGTVTDSDAKGTDAKSAITATYPVTLADSQLTADAFTIDGLTVTGVTRGTKVGEYKITVSEEVAAGKYTITAKSGLADITGATVSETANTATATKVLEPEIMFYRDFEDYTGGDPYNTAYANRDYGTWGIAGDKTYDGATAVQGATGTAVKYPDGININDGNSAFTPKTEGKLYFAFDLDSSAHANATSGVYTQIIFKESGATEDTYGSDVYAFTYNAVKNQYVGGDNQYNSNASWGVNTATGISEDRKNRIELVFDIDDGKIYKYVNGVLGATHDDTEYGNLDDLAYISFNPKGGNVVDNLTVVHYPKAAVQQTFAVESATVNSDDTFSVFLKGSVTDSDAKGTDAKSAITATYPVTLADSQLTAEAFTIDGLTVTGVTRGAKVGEYKITVSEKLAGNTTYAITVKSGISDILGAVVNSENATASVTTGEIEEEPKFEISAFALNEGTATVTYTNTTETPENFVIMVASYVNGIMSEVVTNNITAVKGDVDKVETASLLNGTDGKTVKAFIWNAESLKPLSEPDL